MNDLRGWKTVSLEEVCEVNPRDPGPTRHSAAVSFIPMPAVSEIDGVIRAHDTKPFSEVAKGYTRFREQDVIFAKITPCMENGKSAIATGLHGGLACGSTEFHVLRSKGAVLPEYLWRFVRQKSFRDDAERHMTGAVGQRRVPAQYIKEVKIPVPTLSVSAGIKHPHFRWFCGQKRDYFCCRHTRPQRRRRRSQGRRCLIRDFPTARS